MLSLLRRLAGWIHVRGGGHSGRGGRWVEPSNEVTRAVLNPGAPAPPGEQSLYESIMARYPIPERARRAAVTPPRPAAQEAEPATRAEEQPAAGPRKKPERGRAA